MRRRRMMGALSVALAASMTFVALPAAAAPGATNRIAGTSRYATAAQLATAFGAAQTVVVANGTDAKGGFDALAANYLAGVVKAPILLTGPASLPAETITALRTILGGAGGNSYQIIVMGAADAVSANVVAQLNSIAQVYAKDTANHVVRVAGSNRYATATLAATAGGDDPTGFWVEKYTVGSGSALGKTAFLASGESNADALAAGPVSNALRIPVYLTGAGSLPDPVAKSLTAQGITNLVVLGGADRVPDAVVAAARAAGVQTTVRLAGANRFATAAALYDFARAALTGVDGAHYGSASAPAYLANGLTGFPDALAVGPLAGKTQSVLLTTSAATLDPSAATFLTANRSGISGVTALGAPATVSDAALAAAASALG